jgi:hypothetical protein
MRPNITCPKPAKSSPLKGNFSGSRPNQVGAFKHFNRTAKSKSGVCHNKAQNTQRVDVSLLARLALLYGE